MKSFFNKYKPWMIAVFLIVAGVHTYQPALVIQGANQLQQAETQGVDDAKLAL